jgi:GT2 family glycosyltransferase/MoaA/NifB/PqqE/SkfB family radical SAM enzyme/SAM-dependent methyltransferase
MVAPQPEVSVIIPVHNGRATLPACLHALIQSSGVETEVVLVDDASTDGSGEASAGLPVRVISLRDRVGASAARNRGAEESLAPILAFIDADVRVAPDTLGLMLQALREDPGLAALFGAYDTRCPHPGFFSQYKNLHHHYIHGTSRRDAWTFWTGCGAIRRGAFEAVGGFPPQDSVGADLGDMELGYRLRRAGFRIALLPHIRVIHDKPYGFRSLLRSDVLHRAIPWTRMMWRNRVFRADLNTRAGHLASAILLLAALGSPAAPISVQAKIGGILALLALVAAVNWPWMAFCRRERGWWFAVRAMVMEWLYYLYSAAGATAGTALYLWERLAGRAAKVPRGGGPGAGEAYYLPAPLAIHKGDVVAWGIRRGLGEPDPVGWILKTDLFEEARGEDQILLRPAEPWRSRPTLGIDLSLSVAKRARDRSRLAGEDAMRVVCADVRRLPVGPASLCLALSVSTLDHFDRRGDLHQAVAELNRVIAPGGGLFLVMDNPQNPWVRLRAMPLVKRILRPLGLLRVPLGRTVSWDDMRRILKAEGFGTAEPRFILHYPRALFIHLLHLSTAAPWVRAVERLARITDGWDRRPWGCWTGLYYELWGRKPQAPGEPERLSDLQTIRARRRRGPGRRGRRLQELLDAAGRWGRLHGLPSSAPSRFPLPIHVQIQTQSRCNGRCVHCPYPAMVRDHGQMSWDLYEKIVQEVCSWPHPERRTIHLMLQNEPLLDGRLPQAVGRVKAGRPSPRVSVVTNGTLLTPQLTEALAAAGLDELVISLDAATRTTYERVHLGLSFPRAMAALEVLLGSDPPPFSWALSFLRHRETWADLDAFRSFCRRRGIAHRVYPPVNRAGALDSFSGIQLPGTPEERWVRLRRRLLWGGCRLPMATCCILYTGEMILCCHDWRASLVLGDVRTESIRGIWQGSALGEIRRALAHGKAPAPDPCRRCSLMAAARRT